MATTRSPKRKEEILQALAAMLENHPGTRITTAALAAEVGVSEAALYRHFPSKARMFEGLIEFVEITLMQTVNAILQEHRQTEQRVELILQMLLVFAERNPGICRILTAEALQGEQERLRERVAQLFEKLELQLKQCLRERKLREGKGFNQDESELANMLLAYCEGRVHQFVRSGFTRLPSANFATQWEVFRQSMFG